MDWDVFWSVLFVAFIVVPLIFIWAFAVMDLFGRGDIGGFAKMFWLLAIIFFPLFGTLLYFLFRPKFNYDASPDVAAARAGFIAEKLTQLTDLKDKGVLSQQEFDKQRARLLAE